MSAGGRVPARPSYERPPYERPSYERCPRGTGPRRPHPRGPVRRGGASVRRKRRLRRTRRLARTVLVTLSLVVGGLWWAQDDQPPPGPVLAAAPVGHGVAAPVAARPVVVPQSRPQPPAAPLKRSRPTALAVPAITIQAPVVELGLDGTGHLAVPPVDNPRVVGWYAKGVTPGERGTAVVVGHRDTRTGPAIFLNLNVLNPGNTVRVARADGRVAVFTVDRVRTYDKASFPDDEVYGPSDRAELRLLTCGGLFDRKNGYASNIVVFAHLTGVDRTI
ncbi:hypothetical protein SLA_1250 [Streptomyces laurentii]|uniref:Class F sortase n=1 Tax=Streptomyces laurentii TaxID=39478 RepID=A0A169N795_STRLU|nr:hypothetical protein SLA_1250 [Streptomyces laurentii]